VNATVGLSAGHMAAWVLRRCYGDLLLEYELLVYLQRPFRAGLYDGENIMKRDKGHRIVSANFGETIAARQTSIAVEKAENEGWPMLPSIVDAQPSTANANAVRCVIKHVTRHFHGEWRFWSGLPEVRHKAAP